MNNKFIETYELGAEPSKSLEPLSNVSGVSLTQAEYDQLLAQGKVLSDVSYYITDAPDRASSVFTPPRHTIQKSLNFYQKTGLFFGDSIAAGAKAKPGANQDLVTLTRSMLGMSSLLNKAVGSTRFTHGDINPTIIDKVEETVLDTDYIFIAGGVNDWQSQASLVDYEADLEGLMQYLQQNYSGTVIFISPISYVLEKISWENGYKRAVNKIEIIEYRSILERLVLKYKYNLVCGELFEFPGNLGERANVLLSDGLHPTTYGHQLYAMNLCQALNAQVSISNTFTNSSYYRYCGKVNHDGRCIFVKYKNAQMDTASKALDLGIADRMKDVVAVEGYISDGDNWLCIGTENLVYNKTADTLTVTIPSTFVTKWVYTVTYFTFDSTQIVDNSY